MERQEACPLCDSLGAIEDPLREGCLKKCPECDNPPSPYLTLTLAGWVGAPEEGEVEHCEELQRRMKEQRDARDRFLIEEEHRNGITGFE